MALLPTQTVTTSRQTDYTDKDFDSIKLRLQNLIRSVFPEWTDYNVASFGNILVELFSFVLDVVLFYQDNQALNSRITTATQRRALLGLVKLIGYEPSTASAATVDETFTLAVVPTNDVLFPAGTVVLTEEVTDPIRYQLLEDLTIAAGTNPPTATASCENSESRSETFVSNGLGNQEFILGQVPYIDASAAVSAGNGAYAEVDNFLESTAVDLHYTIAVDQNDRASMRFGNGVNGAVPVGNISADYKTGGGAAGRVDGGKLKKIEGAFSDVLGGAVQVSVTNALASSGGDDRESLAQIKINAPASIRVINRTVALEDFEIHALEVDGVSRALMLTADQDAGVAENSGLLFVIPTGGGVPSTALKAAVLEQVTVTKPSTLTFSVTVQDPVYNVVDINCRVAILNGYVPASVAADIRAGLAEFFAVENSDGTPNTNVDFGGKIVEIFFSVLTFLPNNTAAGCLDRPKTPLSGRTQIVLNSKSSKIDFLKLAMFFLCRKP